MTGRILKSAERCFKASSTTKFLLKPFFGLAIIIFMFYVISSIDFKFQANAQQMADCGSSHETYNMTFDLDLMKFENFSISVDNEYCSTVGKDIIQRGGSAVDAAIAAGLCNGLMNSQSAGIGGGHFMVIHLKNQNKTIAINARESAPFSSFETMFAKKSSLLGGLSTAIPGEIAGFAAAHKIGGRLPWRDLFEPAIRMCIEGYRVSKVMAQAIERFQDYIRQDPILSENFINSETGEVLRAGDLVRRPKLARTLIEIGEKGIDAFYNGILARMMVDEINSNGGNVSLHDFNSYKPVVTDALTLDLDSNYKVSTVSLPSSGILAALVMRVMNKYKLGEYLLDKGVNEALFYHRLIESLKHAFAHRSLLGDDQTPEIKLLMERLKDDEYINHIQSKIDDHRTYPSEYYSTMASVEDHGTAHISILADGDAVSLTSTINTYFGAKYAGRFTGIIYNNQMDDFSTPNKPNYFDLQPSEANYIRPGKRPMSSMSPIIVIDKTTNDPRLVLGASGGSKILSAVAQVAIKTLWMGMNIKDAIDDRRVHHQLYPAEVQVELGFDPKIHRLLLAYGHNVSCYDIGGSIVQGVHKVGEHELWAYGDPRKGGIPAGV